LGSQGTLAFVRLVHNAGNRNAALAALAGPNGAHRLSCGDRESHHDVQDIGRRRRRNRHHDNDGAKRRTLPRQCRCARHQPSACRRPHGHAESRPQALSAVAATAPKGNRSYLRRWAGARANHARSRCPQARMRKGVILRARPQQRHAPRTCAPRIKRGAHRRPSHIFAPAAEPAAGRCGGSRDQPRIRGRRYSALWQSRKQPRDSVLPFSRLCRKPAAARSARAPANRGFRCRPVGERLGVDDARTTTCAGARPRRGDAWRTCAVSRYQSADCRHAACIPARAEKPRLFGRTHRPTQPDDEIRAKITMNCGNQWYCGHRIGLLPSNSVINPTLSWLALGLGR
jgi:hypothetical protein